VVKERCSRRSTKRQTNAARLGRKAATVQVYRAMAKLDRWRADEASQPVYGVAPWYTVNVYGTRTAMVHVYVSVQ
jgi:hypothetical protein